MNPTFLFPLGMMLGIAGLLSAASPPAAAQHPHDDAVYAAALSYFLERVPEGPVALDQRLLNNAATGLAGAYAGGHSQAFLDSIRGAVGERLVLGAPESFLEPCPPPHRTASCGLARVRSAISLGLAEFRGDTATLRVSVAEARDRDPRLFPANCCLYLYGARVTARLEGGRWVVTEVEVLYET